jgi:hypothetical protein
MPRVNERLGSSIIASTDQAGASVGTAIGASNTVIGIQTPEELTGNCYLEASLDDGTTWRRVQSYGVDIALPQNRFIVVDAIPCRLLRAASDVPEFSDREFVFSSILDI